MHQGFRIVFLVCCITLNIAGIRLDASILLEAEDASLHGVSVASSRTGYSGMGYVTGFDQDGDNVTFTVQLSAGMYRIEIGYGTPWGEKGYEITVNGIRSSGMFNEGAANFMEISAGMFYLNEGENTVKIGGGWGWYEIDYIRISEATVSKPLLPASGLSDPLAPLYTQRLYYWLRYTFGSKVIAGQQEFSEINHIKEVTGHSPAIGGFDLIEYSPSRIEYGANPWGNAESWMDWQKEGGGILTLMWHWNAPTDLINDAENPWWSGFYTRATTFNFAEALEDTSSDNYLLLLRDIDSIAAQLKKFQDAEIPILWRPLHEASGGWFWWGAQGPEPFIQLWQLLYDRLTVLHDLHNLIWIYTAGNPEWYPGDAYVDIVSLDIYTDPSSPMSGEWESIQELFNGKKLVTLSETGTIPLPDNIRKYATWWSYFCIWNGNFLYDIPDETLITVYSDEDIITLDELPVWEDLDMEVLSAEKLNTAEMKIYPVPSNEEIMISFPDSDHADFRLSITDLQGKIHREWILNGISERNIYTFTIANLPPGNYIVSVRGPIFSSTSLIMKL